MTESPSPELRIVPANEASWEALQAVFGARGDPSHCYCQRYKMQPGESWASVGAEELAFRFRRRTDCGHPDSQATSGLVAYLDGEPVGWCAVEPRTAYPRLLLKTRVPWEGRAENKTDDSVWAVTCFVTRTGFRRRGVSRELARAAVDFARQRGARALEGYPMVTEPGRDVMPGELHVGTRSVFAAAGFAQVSRPTLRRAVMRIEFESGGRGAPRLQQTVTSVVRPSGTRSAASVDGVIEEGKPAPDFALPSDSGETVSLESLRGKPVVLYFYPKDDTPGCTAQACGIRDAWKGFQDAGAVVLGVSPDGEASHATFKAKYELPFPLLADADHSVSEAYGVWGEKSYAGKTYMGVDRTTFVIGADGTVERIFREVKPAEHADQVLEALSGD